MGEPAMQLGDAELARIGGYVKDNLRQWLTEVAPAAVNPPPAAPDPIPNAQLLERMVRVEEELKGQRELFVMRFDAIDRRFEDVNTRFEDMNTRFETIDRRFEDMNSRFEDVNARFEAVDRRFEDMIGRFEAVDRRFEAVDRRFEDMIGRFEAVDRRFEDVNTRFEDMKDYLDKRFNAMTWMIGLLTTVVVAVLGISLT